MLLTAYCDAAIGSYVESEFLRREVGLLLKKVNPEEFNSLNADTVIILTSDLNKWKGFFSRAAKQSVVLLYFGNEYYNSEKVRDLGKFKCLKEVFVQYLPSISFRKSLVLNSLMFTIQTPRVLIERSFYSSIKTALEASRSITATFAKFEVPTTFFPLGYTNRFVSEVKCLVPDLEEDKSIFDLNFNELGKTKTLELGFVGQKGSWFRRKLLESFKNFPQSSIEMYSGWGGGASSTGTKYLETLMRSRMFLCPPGNQSNETPRYYECLAVGTIPIITKGTLQDPFDFKYLPSILNRGIMIYSYKYLTSFYSRLSDEEFSNVVSTLRNMQRARFAEIRNQIEVLVR